MGLFRSTIIGLADTNEGINTGNSTGIIETWFDNKQVFKPKRAEELSVSQRNNALNLITMIKEKHDGKIKGRACADGRKQRQYISKDEVSSPTVKLESLMITLLIDATEKRDVAMADIVGAYLLANMDDYVLVK